MEKLENPFQEEFNQNALVPWELLKSGKIAGKVKAAGGEFTAGNFTYVVVHEAGRVGGVGAEIGAEVQKKCFLKLSAPVKLITGWE